MPTANLAACLTQEQIGFFKAEGYLVVEGLIEPAYVDQWRSRLWGEFGGAAEDVSSWKNRVVTPSANFEPERLRFHHHPGVSAIVEQLGGGRFVCGHDSCVTNWPVDTMAWRASGGGHIDGYNASIGWWPFMLSGTTYVHDVGAMSGALTVWPRSHLNAWRYFRENPGHISGGYWQDPAYLDAIYKNTPAAMEVTARAGDVIFWHAFLVHEGSMNVSNRPRVALFTRWQHEAQDAIKYEVPADLWKYWAV